MDTHDTTSISRRAAIAALAGTPAFVGTFAVAIATPAAAEDKSQWDRLLAAYDRAKAAEDHYDRSVWTPAYEADNAEEARQGNPWPGVDAGRDAIARYRARKAEPAWREPQNLTTEINDEFDRLVAIRCEAEGPLMACPAPDAKAFARKIQIAFADDRAAYHFIDDLLADAARILGREG